jgi:two-component system OmpR family sensor kinase
MSLRARILAGSAAIALVLVVAAFVVARITEAHLVERVDAQLGTRADGDEVTNTVVGRAGGAHCEARLTPGAEPPSEPCIATGDATGSNTMPEQEASSDGEAGADEVCRWEDAGAPASGELAVRYELYRSLNPFVVSVVTETGVEPEIQPQGDAPVPAIDRGVAIEAAASGEPFTTGSENSDTRFRARAVTNQVTGEVYVLSQSLADVDATIGRLIAVEVAATLAILAALGLVAWWVNRHGIRPVERMTATASAIAAGDLSHRVPQVDYGTEAGRLGSALNQMLARIEHAFDERTRSEGRLRQFVADASHELRTPVTTIRGYSELYESGGLATDDELSEAMRRTRQEALRMGNLVDDMLLLARLDEGRDLDRSRVDLAALVSDAGRDARAVDPDRVVVTTTDGPLEVMGDSDRLRQVIANLVGNASVHTPAGTPVHVTVASDNGDARVVVADEGPGIDAANRSRIFERFYRADRSRSRASGGAGLGLSIVEGVVAAHGGRLEVDDRPGGGARFTVWLPQHRPATD